jgi:hypothetical protein
MTSGTYGYIYNLKESKDPDRIRTFTGEGQWSEVSGISNTQRQCAVNIVSLIKRTKKEKQQS